VTHGAIQKYAELGAQSKAVEEDSTIEAIRVEDVTPVGEGQQKDHSGVVTSTELWSSTNFEYKQYEVMEGENKLGQH
jgi:hypothetical protein